MVRHLKTYSDSVSARPLRDGLHGHHQQEATPISRYCDNLFDDIYQRCPGQIRGLLTSLHFDLFELFAHRFVG